MLQLTQQLKDGTMEVMEVPAPALKPGNVLVRNHYSVISAGTEGKTVKDARLGYLGKARARKEEVGKVLRMAKTQGVMKTYEMVMNKLEAPSALGYSCAGEVIAVGSEVRAIKVGDCVACGGSGAVHAEIVSVPQNLCARIEKNTSLRDASFATIAAIALQGVRQADLRLAENCLVIGLGLIGQLTSQMLRAAGVRVFGVDISSDAVELALENGIEMAMTRDTEGLDHALMEFTRGHGVDAVIITAATSSHDPVELAGSAARKKGKVVIVGAVPTGFSRKNYYRKELDLRMSSSYGPGRYDVDYEEKGRDYPIGYVRWTEQRNMQAFLDLLEDRRINMDRLVTHTFPLAEAASAYDMILRKTEPFVGVLLRYDTDKPVIVRVDAQRRFQPTKKVAAGFAGAGSFAQNFLLPNLKGAVDFTGVVTARSNTARNVMNKYGFQFASTDVDELMADDNTNTVFVATRHDMHGALALAALSRGKHLFVEKPLCLTRDELEEIRKRYEEAQVHLMLGFNRRFAPLVTHLKAQLNPTLPVAMHYRINAGQLPADHWVHDPEVGGGRIIGEACHFIDLLAFLAGSRISTVSAVSLEDATSLADTVTIQLTFENGSVGSIDYYSNGSRQLAKEYLEVFSGGTVYQLDDFREVRTISGKVRRKKASGQDKGHRHQLERFIHAIENQLPTPIAFDEVYNATLTTFLAVESLKERGVRKSLT